MRRLKIFFDGGCRPNPGRMEVAAVAQGIPYVDRDIGTGSGHEAEWRALLHAVRIARALGAKDIELIGDSIAIIGVASGVQKPRPADLPHLAAYRSAIAGLAVVRLRHVRRSKNLAGIALAQGHPR